MKDNKVYIYNPEQARFYRDNGIMPIDFGIHKKTNRPYFVFKYDETREVYDKWCNRKH